MNQSILINDDLAWNQSAGRVEFSAICAGSIVICQLSPQYLINKGLDRNTSPEHMIKFCETITFDIEDDAQQAIDDEQHIDESVLVLS